MNLTALFQQFANTFKNEIRTAVPAQIIAFDSNNLTVDVFPLIKGIRIAAVSQNGRKIKLETGEMVVAEDYDLPAIVKVPVAMMWWENYGITMPINPGAQGLLIVCDRDIRKFKDSQVLSAQASLRRFDLNDSNFLPFLPKKASISDYNSSAIELRYADIKLAVSGDGVTVTGDLQVNGDIIANNITGNTSIVAPQVVVNGLDFAAHKHSYLNGSTPSETGTPE